MSGRKFIGVCVKAILTSAIAVILVNYFNIFESFGKLNADAAFDIGLGVYMSIVGAALEFVFSLINSNFANISVNFGLTRSDDLAGNTPLLKIKHEVGVGTIYCHIAGQGNGDLIRKQTIIISLPQWISSQALQSSHFQYDAKKNQISVSLEEFIPENDNGHDLDINFRISLIINDDDTNLAVTIHPSISGKRISFVKMNETGFRVMIC